MSDAMEDIVNTISCDICTHPLHEHDGMGDCHHHDKRTSTGYCAAHTKYGTGEVRVVAVQGLAFHLFGKWGSGGSDISLTSWHNVASDALDYLDRSHDE